MTRRRRPGAFSPLEAKALTVLHSLMKDRGEWDEDEQVFLAGDCGPAWVRLSDFYDRAYSADGPTWQRQPLRRALQRLFDQGLVAALALGWCDVADAGWVGWAGGGKRAGGQPTPKWKLVLLTTEGIRAAESIAEAAR